MKHIRKNNETTAWVAACRWVVEDRRSKKKHSTNRRTVQQVQEPKCARVWEDTNNFAKFKLLSFFDTIGDDYQSGWTDLQLCRCSSGILKVLKSQQEVWKKKIKGVRQMNWIKQRLPSQEKGLSDPAKAFQLDWSATRLLCLLSVASFSWQCPHWLTHQAGQLCFARDNVLIKGLQYLIKIRCRCFYRGRSNEGRAASRWEVERMMGLILLRRQGQTACRGSEFAEGNVWPGASSRGLKVSSGKPFRAESPGVSITSGRCETDLDVCM